MKLSPEDAPLKPPMSPGHSPSPFLQLLAGQGGWLDTLRGTLDGFTVAESSREIKARCLGNQTIRSLLCSPRQGRFIRQRALAVVACLGKEAIDAPVPPRLTTGSSVRQPFLFCSSCARR